MQHKSLVVIRKSSLNDLKLEESFIKYVLEDIDNITQNFFDIGFRLNEANNCGYYKRLGYLSIEDLAEKCFDFSRSTTYGLMKIASTFADSSHRMKLNPAYSDYSQSQLYEMTSLEPRERFLITSGTSVADIKKYKKLLKKGATLVGCNNLNDFFENNRDLLDSVQTSGLSLSPIDKLLNALYRNIADLKHYMAYNTGMSSEDYRVFNDFNLLLSSIRSKE